MSTLFERQGTIIRKKKKKRQQGADSLLCTMAQVAGIGSVFHPADRTVGFPSSHSARIAQVLRLDRVVRALLPCPPPPPHLHHLLFLLFLLPSLPFLRRPIRRLSALLISVDLLRMLLLSRLRRRRVLPYQRIQRLLDTRPLRQLFL